MKLIRQVVRIQAAQERRRSVGRAVGIVWTDAKLQDAGRETGCFDVFVERGRGSMPDRWTTRPRAPAGPRDLGDVYDEAGAKIGRVVRVRGSLVEYEDLPASGAGGRPRRAAGGG